MKGDISMFRLRFIAIIAAFSAGMSAFCGCTGIQVPAGLSAAASTNATVSETTTAASTSSVSRETKQTEETTAGAAEVKIGADTIKTKRAALKGGEYDYACGITYLGESENQAAMEVVLTELGVSEDLLKDQTRFIDCGGSDLWLICISDDIDTLKVTMGEDENGKELYMAAKGSIPEYIFIRCFSSGEMASCTVFMEGEKTGETTYFPIMIGDQIVVPNGGTVINQSEGYETYIDVPNEAAADSEETEEEEP